ncbi:ubiquinol-cytochrome c reductase cytochrome b subunit [Planosporangium flavigriseum]|uniref:Cytochrome bc1 complex cytochrome b subunit n=1 Tax=Planosporangium flavigriseum TaxID=373681 RepID=A0A8J3PLY6_9ACTN|nr:ubiquinol-cytochrome c reductase cytochrome b subunit [Planosporangium flavigriseum]NJC66913.1 ubiquinol-cytochrome c reductase cytochrome b subunit [Planosporangium flavigriseum]GIG74342.1 ubiquinol-cytochrome c reductase cytochrome b subunit [Planosporangium flavigriseum]
MTKRRKRGDTRGARVARSTRSLDNRLGLARPLRAAMNKVFPDHWSFLLGEIALYSLVILILTGTFLALFYEPTQRDVVYRGSYVPLRGVPMTRAFETTLNISFDVRGGLIIRQMHHWASLLFLAGIVAHMLRIFFTGAFRRPREINWVIGLLLFWLGFVEGFAGYSLPDDALSGTGLRIAHAIILSIPVVGTWVATSLFGGEFPGTEILPRLYIVHVLLVPGLLLTLVAVHLGIVVRQKHTQWPGPGRTEHNVVGVRMVPGFAGRSSGFFMLVFAIVALLGGLFQINPIWIFGPYQAAVVSAATQPDWYVWFLDGALRLLPPWELRLFRYTVPPAFWAGVVLPGVLTMLALAYPWVEQRRRISGDRPHHLLQRPRDVPTRTALGAMALAFYLVLALSAANDVIAYKFHVSLNAIVVAGRIGLLLLPPLAYYVTHRVCLALQQHDREVLVHGMETGIMKRLPSGRFVEVHQPLGPTDEHGHGELEYGGWTVPKRINQVGGIVPPVRGFFRPIEEPVGEREPDEHEVRAGKGSGTSRDG